MNEAETSETQQSLSLIAEYFAPLREQGTVKFYEMLAVKLSRIVGKDPAWTWRYVQGVHKGSLAPSKTFAMAVGALGATLDEIPAILAYTEEVRVFAEPGKVQPGAVILGESRPCARPGCRVVFVPHVDWQVYCSPRCRSFARTERRSGTRRSQV